MNESTGEVLQLGDTLRMQALSKTLKEIAEHGVDVFYKGSIGTKVVEDIQRRGGILTRDDLIHYRFVTIETSTGHPPIIALFIIRICRY